MLAQVLHVAHLEAALLRHQVRLAEYHQLHVGEDVSIAEIADHEATNRPLPGRVPPPGGARVHGDAVVQEEPAGPEQLIDLGKVLRMAAAHVLEHPHARDLVEQLAAQVAIIHQLHTDAVVQALRRDAP